MALRGVPRLFHYSINRYVHVTSRANKMVQFVLSDIGEGIREVVLREWYVKIGDKVAQFDDLCLVESDKASVNITSRFDGVIKRLYHKEGDTAYVGKALVDIDVPDAIDIEAKVDPVRHPPHKEEIKEPVKNRLKSVATPAVRRIAKENNLVLTDIKGTGKDGRVMKSDVLDYMKKPLDIQTRTSDTNVDKVIDITGVKKIMVRTMTQSNSIPSFMYCDEINVSKIVNLRKEMKEYVNKMGTSMTYMPLFIKAVSKALETYPELNARVDANCEKLIIKGEHNIGIAIDTKDGLIVPNIKNVQQLSIMDINRELARLIENAKNRKMTPMDISGGTFTISNIGILGGTYVSPLINPPEVGILGIGRFQRKPIIDEEDKLVKATMCNVSWSADHRVIDGATMARFANLWRDYIQHPSYLMLDI